MSAVEVAAFLREVFIEVRLMRKALRSRSWRWELDKLRMPRRQALEFAAMTGLAAIVRDLFYVDMAAMVFGMASRTARCRCAAACMRAGM